MKTCYYCFKSYDESISVCPHCGMVENDRPDEPIYLAPGTVLMDRFIIGHSLGAGGFGIVYKAWDSKLETVVAVKEFFVSRIMTRAEGVKEVIVNRKSLQEYEYRKERFLAEARTMAKFGAHRSITNVFEFFEENDTAYIVMELLQGMPLNEYITKNNGKLDIDFSVFIANEIGNALKSMHDQNIIHRDVSPDNIFICTGKEIRIKLMDLGAAKLSEKSDDVIDIILKPGYSPVEQYDNGKNVGPWSDIYALGSTLYMMLTGVKPEESTNRKIDDTVVPANQLNPQISENLNNTIMKAMAVDRHMRFKNVSDFLSALNGERKVVTLAKEKKIKKTKRAAGILAAALALAVAAVFVGQSFKNRKAEFDLKPAYITVWFPVSDSSSREDAISSVIQDFTQKFSKVNIEYRAIPEEEYEQELANAARNDRLPNLFMSTGVSPELLEDALELDSVLSSEQAKECLFLDQYESYYSDKKQIPLAIEVPLAYVITSGHTSIDYDSNYFCDVTDFGNVKIAYDSRYEELLEPNFSISKKVPYTEFTKDENTSPVLLSSTMCINEIRKLQVEKKYVYYDAPGIRCGFTYEWSVGPGSEDEVRAAETLLSWMLGNVYQTMLLVNSGGSGQIPEIPVNRQCFETKLSVLNNLTPIANIYDKFSFIRED